MKKHKAFWEVWEQVELENGEIIFKYVDTFKDVALAVELARWNSNYCIKKLGRGEDG
jgi:hypothetical protein